MFLLNILMEDMLFSCYFIGMQFYFNESTSFHSVIEIIIVYIIYSSMFVRLIMLLQ